jgi:hypothetical protein
MAGVREPALLFLAVSFEPCAGVFAGASGTLRFAGGVLEGAGVTVDGWVSDGEVIDCTPGSGVVGGGAGVWGSTSAGFGISALAAVEVTGSEFFACVLLLRGIYIPATTRTARTTKAPSVMYKPR